MGFLLKAKGMWIDNLYIDTLLKDFYSNTEYLYKMASFEKGQDVSKWDRILKGTAV